MRRLEETKSGEITQGYITKYILETLWVVNFYRKRNSRAPVDKIVFRNSSA